MQKVIFSKKRNLFWKFLRLLFWSKAKKFFLVNAEDYVRNWTYLDTYKKCINSNKELKRDFVKGGYKLLQLRLELEVEKMGLPHQREPNTELSQWRQVYTNIISKNKKDV